jgi:hypothetical protein
MGVEVAHKRNRGKFKYLAMTWHDNAGGFSFKRKCCLKKHGLVVVHRGGCIYTLRICNIILVDDFCYEFLVTVLAVVGSVFVCLFVAWTNLAPKI